MTRRSPINSACSFTLAWLALAAAGCGAPAITSLRFQDHAPVWRVEDRLPVPKPQPRETGTARAYLAENVRTPLLSDLALPGHEVALDINALGEVPDSTWFENRIGTRELSPRDVARGPNRSSIDRSAALSVHRVHLRSGTIAIDVADATGARYTLAFDASETPELQTGAQVAVQRLLWAAGYRVPESEIVCLQRKDLEIARGAVASAANLAPSLLTERELDDLLALAPAAADAPCWRAVAIRNPPGVPIDGFSAHGVREDDENDRIAHERRRSLRGLRLFYAWLGNSVINEQSTLDVWREDDRVAHRGHVVHTLHDFVRAFGALGLDLRHEHDGYATHFDLADAAAAVIRFGAWQPPWELPAMQPPRGVGRYDAVHFDPARYAPEAAYAPFSSMDDRDAYWAAKIIARFTLEQIAAAVEQAAYSDPRTRSYLIATIRARQRMLVRYWLSRISAIDDFTLEHSGGAQRLCARDLMIAYGLTSAGAIRHVARSYDARGAELARARVLATGPDGGMCMPVTAGRFRGGYTLVELKSVRGGRALPKVIVHLGRDRGTGQLRVIGIER